MAAQRTICDGAILRRLSSAINETSPKSVIDFGALCGEINYRLAKQFPEVGVYGVDRQEIVKKLNDEAYSLPNLHFRDGDIFESLKTVDEEFVLFTKTRTTVLCYPDFVRGSITSAIVKASRLLLVLSLRALAEMRAVSPNIRSATTRSFSAWS